MKALITGAYGFVGSYLSELLIQSGHDIIQADSDSCDITNLKRVKEVIQHHSPDVIYHLAALAHVPTCQKNLDRTIEINVQGTFNLVRAAMESGIYPRFVFISTANVYGLVTPDEIPITEESEVRPNNNYALSKYMAEGVVNMYSKETGAKSVIFRPFNHIGPGQDDNYVISSFAKQIAEIKNGKSEAIMKVGNLAASRDFADVRDVVRAYVLAATEGSGLYNLCSGEDHSIQKMLDMLIELSGQKVRVEVDPERYRENDLPVLRGDYSKAEKDLKWKPEIPLKQSLQDILNYWDKQALSL